MQDKLIVNLSQEEEIRATVPDINYIPAYKVAEEQRRSNELERQAYYEEIQRKVNNGEFNGEQGPQGIQGEQGPKGDAGSIKFTIVNELPTTNIDENAMYLKKLVDEEEQNKYEEYIYTENGWELVGTAKVEVDLTGYVKNTDLVTNSTPGLAKVGSGYGVWVTNKNELYVARATNTEIDARKSDYKPIVPANLDYAVKSVVGGHVTLTQTEYDELETIDENTYYYIKEEE